ncbi:Protein of unknown function [Bacillus cereus]|nr:Protein of unknown function [Bacillus cereus]
MGSAVKPTWIKKMEQLIKESVTTTTLKEQANSKN